MDIQGISVFGFVIRLQSVAFSKAAPLILSLALTKIDIMDTFKEIKVAVGYKLDGKEIDYMPGTVCLVADWARLTMEFFVLQRI